MPLIGEQEEAQRGINDYFGNSRTSFIKNQQVEYEELL